MSATVTLQYPVQYQGTDYTALSMRRPKVRDQKAASKVSKDPAEQECRLFANLCEVAPEVLDELDLVDYQALQDAFKGFFPEADSQD